MTRRPLLIYDGRCEFWRVWIARWQRVTRGRVEAAPSETAAAGFPSIPSERFAESVVLVEPGGRVSYGAEAVCRSLAHAPGGGVWLWLYLHAPGFASASEWAYRRVARRRSLGWRARSRRRDG